MGNQIGISLIAAEGKQAVRDRRSCLSPARSAVKFSSNSACFFESFRRASYKLVGATFVIVGPIKFNKTNRQDFPEMRWSAWM